ncbi:E3 ubiquitin-protein ligase rfwd3.S-like [Haliotis asinina]|uniref:E3 ubiquitin-protein ligase rfwd3.S-like n=1 Tax=Haliotis asinina TaxID=109174 RepID=UPI0035324446
MEVSDVGVEAIQEEVVVADDDLDDDTNVVLPGLQQVAVSPDVVDISDSASGDSGDDIFVVYSDEEDIIQDSESESNEVDVENSAPPSPQQPTTMDPSLPQLEASPQETTAMDPSLPVQASPQQPTGSDPALPQLPLESPTPTPGTAREAGTPHPPADGGEITLTDPPVPPSDDPRTIVPASSARTQSLLNASLAEFRSPKRQKRSSPEKLAPANVESDEDSDCCPICFEPWTTSGSHRLASLRCGHLFGQSCIDKWLKGQGGKCPHCNAKAKRQDIRVLYTKSIKAVDTTERDRALAELEKEKEHRRKAELEAAHSRLQYQLCIEECNRFRQELNTTRTQLQQLRSQMNSGQHLSQSLTPDGASQLTANMSGKRFVMDRTVKIWEAGQCRVLAYSSSLGALIVSQPSSSSLFPGFGIKKLSAMDFKTSQYMTIHSKAIRDICFHPTFDNGILLSCGLDKTAKMTSVMSNNVVQTYQTPVPVWSCVWNIDDPNYFYTGLMNGSVLEYDVRNTQTHVQQLNTGGSKSPVVAMQYIPRDHTAIFRPGGLVVGQLDRTSFFENKGTEQPRLNFLPLEGSLTSLSFDNHTRHLLASFRPTAKHATVRHQLCEMSCSNLSTDPAVTDNLCSCDVVHTFQGGRTQSVLSRSALVPNPSDPNKLLVCAGDETSNAIHIWDCSSGQQCQRISTGAFVVDLTTFAVNSQHFLVALTEKMLKVHKWC